MLELKNIVKDYVLADEKVHALKGISLKFRNSEFVSILGPSGCGKTTMLNIIGGLDRYTSGDLIINGKSTKQFKDKDWDTYRNHSVGFIFQSYNLIPHQTVLENVELALTLSGVSSAERKQRAKDVLTKVGLGNKLKQKPNQLSGGQMQRVAIARALINDPEILLADEPTGALDSKTSKQIMDLLKEISSDRLVIMVTHNPELAEEYSSRIVKFLDGELVDDSNPLVEQQEIKVSKVNKGKKRTSMSIFTALSLSLKNLLTKKARTILVSFAGSIGIIGIALILSLSSGFQLYIDTVQKDTLSNYPVSIKKQNVDLTSMLLTMRSDGTSNQKPYGSSEEVSMNPVFSDVAKSLISAQKENDLKSFKKYLEDEKTAYDKSKVSAIQYTYDIKFSLFSEDLSTDTNYTNLNTNLEKALGSFTGGMGGTGTQNSSMGIQVYTEMLDNQEFVKSQYELVGKNSKWANPNDKEEVMLVVDKYNRIPDYAMLALGLESSTDFQYRIMYPMYRENYVKTHPNATEQEIDEAVKKPKEISLNISEDLIGREYFVLLNGNLYEKIDGKYVENTTSNKTLVENGLKIKIKGLIRQKESVSAGSISGFLAYNKALTNYLLEQIKSCEVINAQLESKDKDVLTNEDFGVQKELDYKNNLDLLGYADIDNPSQIAFYPTSFENKDYVIDYIKGYNKYVKENVEGGENKEISYTDYLGVMMSSINVIINAISYVLIGFVSISLVVSSIMIGIITYISVLERIKEIGVLRAIGASKRDISRVFNAEAIIIGLFAGAIGIGITLLLNIPINLIIGVLADIQGVAKLPLGGGILLVVLSVFLTFIAGLIPSKIASKKDPVVALRSE